MALPNIWRGLFSILTGGVSNIFASGGLDNLGNILGNAGDVANDIGNQNILGNYLASKTGSRLTDAQREANAWTAQREDVAWNRSVEMANTQYQRQVQDLQAAGLNPMLALGQSYSSPTASTTGSVSPTSGGSILADLSSILKLREELGLIRAQRGDVEAAAENKRADTALKEAETKGQIFINDINELTRDAQVESKNLQNQLTDTQIRHLYKQMDSIDADISKKKAETDSEIAKLGLIAAEIVLKNASAYQILQLLPYEKALKSAQTDSARAAACYSAIQTAYQQKLLSDGYVDSLVKEAAATSGIKANEKELSDIRTALRTGQNYPESMNKSLFQQIFTSQGFIQAATIFLDNFNPLAGLLGVAK